MAAPGLSCSSGIFVLCCGTWVSQFSRSSGVFSLCCSTWVSQFSRSSGIWFPDQRSNPSALHWEHRVLATGSPRTSSALLLLTAYLTYIIYNSTFVGVCSCAHAQSCLTLCDAIDCSPPGSSVHGIFQAKIPECVAISFSRGPSRPRDRTHISYVSCIGRRVLYHWLHLVILKVCTCFPSL